MKRPARWTERDPGLRLDEIAELRRRVVELEDDIDELRRDSRRVAELYDLVFEHLREQRNPHIAPE